MIETTIISNARWEAVHKMMNRYQHSTGDTYGFALGFKPRLDRYPVDLFFIVVEFTSSTQYRWWGFFHKGSEVYRW